MLAARFGGDAAHRPVSDRVMKADRARFGGDDRAERRRAQVGCRARAPPVFSRNLRQAGTHRRFGLRGCVRDTPPAAELAKVHGLSQALAAEFDGAAAFVLDAGKRPSTAEGHRRDIQSPRKFREHGRLSAILGGVPRKHAWVPASLSCCSSRTFRRSAGPLHHGTPN